MFCEVRAKFERCNEVPLGAANERFGVVAPFGGPTSSGMLTLHCPPDKVHDLARFLREYGADTVIVTQMDYVFSRQNPLFARLTAAI
jgi:ATP phosphoribosyltransferase